MSTQTDRLERKIDSMFDLVDKLPNDEVKARLAEYLCIRTSGLIEQVVKELVSEFMNGNSQQEVSKYVTGKMKNVTNLNYVRLEKLLESFSEEWQHQYKARVSREEEASLNSILNLRNSIAHGGSNTASYLIVKAHYTNVKTVIAHLKLIVSKRSQGKRTRKTA